MESKFVNKKEDYKISLNFVDKKKNYNVSLSFVNKKRKNEMGSIIGYFIKLCLEQNIDKIIEFCIKEEYVDMLREQFEEEAEFKTIHILEYIFKEILKMKNGKEFIKNLISDEIFIKNNLSIFFIEKLIELVNKNEIDDLINLFITNEKINQIIKNSIILDKNNKMIFNNILIYTSKNNNNPNCELFTIEMLKNSYILETLFNYNNGQYIIGYIFHNSLNNINIVKKILENKNIVKKICQEQSFGQFFMNIPNYNAENIFNIFFDEEIISKIGKNYINGCFNNSIQNERMDILEKLFNTELINKIDNFYLSNALIFLCKNNKIEFINLLINGNVIIENDKLIECFKIACNNKNEDIVRLLLSKREIEEKIGENEIEEGERKISFLKSCDCEDVSVAKAFIINKSYILTEEIIDKLNKEKTPLLYNILNKNNFNEEDIRVTEILIKKGLKINNTSKIVRENINKLIEYLDNEGKILEKQHFGIINSKKLEKTEEAIEKIKIFINIKKSLNNINANLIENNNSIILN